MGLRNINNIGLCHCGEQGIKFVNNKPLCKIHARKVINKRRKAINKIRTASLRKYHAKLKELSLYGKPVV